MHTSDVYHTHGIRGFKAVNTKYIGGDSIVKLSPDPRRSLSCPICHSRSVTLRKTGESRMVIGLPCGGHKTIFEVPVYRLNCQDCSSCCREELLFCSKWARYTHAVARYVIDLRSEMSIKALADHVGLDWRTVKEIEKNHLSIKYKRIRLKDVRIIGIDEIHIGKGYKTIVRDLESGAVLFVGTGKGGDALAPFKRKVRSSACKIEVVAMDMSNAYSAWVRKNLLDAKIVFDHFHVIQLMNKKLDQLRRDTMNVLDEEEKKKLKKKRFLYLKGEETLTADEESELNALKAIFEDLSTAHAMKEKLRFIYRAAITEVDAELLLESWIKSAKESGITCLNTMANTLTRHFDGVLGYWKFNRLTNAGMEGFNNKVRWLISQAFGFRDQEYFRLKIFDLPTCTTVKKI